MEPHVERWTEEQGQIQEEGHAKGVEWAEKKATLKQVRALSRMQDLVNEGKRDHNDHLLPLLLSYVDDVEHHCDPEWVNLADDLGDEDFAIGFIEGALSIWERDAHQLP